MRGRLNGFRRWQFRDCGDSVLYHLRGRFNASDAESARFGFLTPNDGAPDKIRLLGGLAVKVGCRSPGAPAQRDTSEAT